MPSVRMSSASSASGSFLGLTPGEALRRRLSNAVDYLDKASSPSARAAKLPSKRAVVLVDKLLAPTRDGAFYFVRVCGSARGQKVVADSSFQRPALSQAPSENASVTCTWREQIFVPVEQTFEIQVRKTGVAEDGTQLPSVLVGTVTPGETDGFITLPVLSQGALTTLSLSLSVPPMVEALDHTATLQVDRLFGADCTAGEYLLQAGLPGQETCTTPAAPAEAAGGATWHHVLTGVPQATRGISVVVFRKAGDGVERLGRALLPHTTRDWTKFDLLDKDDQPTGREIRVNIPEPDVQPRRKSWFRSLTSKTLALPPKEAAALMGAASLRQQLPTIAEAPPASTSSKRSRTPRRSTRKKGIDDEFPEWSDAGSDAEGEDQWPAEPEDSWPEPEPFSALPAVSVKDRIRGGAFQLSDSVVAAKERSGFSVPDKPAPQKKFGKDFAWPSMDA